MISPGNKNQFCPGSGFHSCRPCGLKRSHIVFVYQLGAEQKAFRVQRDKNHPMYIRSLDPVA